MTRSSLSKWQILPCIELNAKAATASPHIATLRRKKPSARRGRASDHIDAARRLEELEAAFQELSARHEGLLESLNDIVFTVGPDGVLYVTNFGNEGNQGQGQVLRVVPGDVVDILASEGALDAALGAMGRLPCVRPGTVRLRVRD